ncbi:LOW QUALITY PROTEIN: alpha-protein kinase 3 [Oxyura jamaicensis]|uniref:LOW QUALITY PROTEIN: alpha-protein kinase 3 n=1 Tax=Oxyura jamaicensis TaxID=8884 RepID=UPI0015A68AF8|nr:LOW QUALITY PROTEIN: alpha-protein kinase 3 [Oxyura jamaicensis]
MPPVIDRAASGAAAGRGSRSPAAAMGSPRRALGNSYAGNGRLSPPLRPGSVEGAEEAESAAWASRPNRRSYLLSIRPQNSLSSSRFSLSSLGRSTFCAIISQLTEETQPLFETTIKSRSVSEDSDAKFTCIVTGYPQPEVTWYKDDEEMDRYCGLPKYEIFCHGNRHTLQLYKCREEDAGIYQASARNTKGIVSCSGVLEVGTMTEFKIHQKWFAKIKRKAEEKLREIEQSKKRGKENVEVENVQGMSPDRLQRKRRLARDLNLRSGASLWEKEDAAKVHVGDSQSRFHEAELKEQSVNTMTGLPNKLVAPLKAEVTTNGDACLETAEENGNGFLAYIYETVEDLVAKPMAKDSAAKKKKKVEDAPAAKQEVSKREESGRDRTKPSANPRFAPPVPLRRNAHLRVASDQEAENIPKIKESGKAVNQDAKINGDVHFSLKEMYFDNQVKAAAEKEEAGAKEEAVKEAALQPAGVSRQTEGASSSLEVSKAGPAPPEGRKSQHTAQKSEGHKAVGPEVAGAVGRSASDLKHPVSGPTVDPGQQASKVEEPKKETPVCREPRGSGKRMNPRLRPQEPPKPPPPDHTQPNKEHPPSRKQSEGHSHTLEGRETQQGLSNQGVKSQGNKEPLPKKLSPPEPGENTPEQNAHQTMVKDGKSKEAGLEPSGSEPCAEARGSSVAESLSPVVGGTHLGLQETETPAPTSVRVAKEESSPVVGGTPLGLREAETPAPTSGRVAEEEPIPTLAAGTLVAQEALPAAQGKESAAGEALSGAQLLPPASKATETKKADGSAPEEEFPASASGEESAKQVPVVPQRKEGVEQTAAAPNQEPAAPLGTFERGTEIQPQAPLVLPNPEKPQEMTLEEKMQHKNLVSSLKSYLLLLLKMSDSSNSDTKEDAEPRDEEQPTAEEAALPEIGIAGLSPRTSRRVLEKVQNNQLFQTAENLPLTPRTTRRITGLIHEEFVTSKEMLACRPVPPKRRTKVAPEAEGSSQLSVPSIVVGSVPAAGVGQHPNNAPNLPPASPEKESPSDPLAALPCATPEELASGARRKIYLPKTKQAGEEEEATPESQGHARSPNVSPRQSRKSAALLQTPALAPSPPAEQRSPTLMRKMATLEVPKLYDEPTGDSSNDPEVPEDAKLEGQPAESKKANNPFKAPQVIRKIRAEQFSDASGNLKLWCQFFNILSDSKLMWYKDEIPVAEAQRSTGDEGQAALAIVQASQKDCGVYRCVISNEYGTDSTDFLLSSEVLSGFILREEIEVGEEIEMTPMVFAKGLADAGYWGDKFFGRVVSEDMEVGAGFLRKACRARAIYGLEPIFESGHTCIIKVHNFIVFGTKNENSLIEKNYDITIQECKIQNSSREYCKIFAAEARAVPDFGAVPEIIPLYLIYRPANNIPYATLEEDLGGPCEQYCVTERDGSLVARGTSEIVLKCCAFQHWVYQWTNGNILVTDMEGVGWKMTNVRIATNLKGYQGLKESCFPSLLEQFATTHQCNHYCSILGLKTLEPAKPKGPKSPSTGRKSTQSSPQLPKKGMASPQGTRKATVSPRSSRRAVEAGEAQAASKLRSGEGSGSSCPQ